MPWATMLQGFLAAIVIASVTAPVGVSGAVFLLPVQLDVLHVPNPAVTPTNLLYNVIAGPGALMRYRRTGQLAGPLTRRLLIGAVPGVVAGAVLRVHAVPGPTAFRLVAGVVLLSIGSWLIQRTLSRQPSSQAQLSDRRITVMALLVGVVGGIYGIGGGSIIGPVLVGSGMAVASVAPAALATTFVTSVVGAGSYGVLSLTTSGSIAPHWSVGVACGVGGFIGGYIGARLQPRLPEVALHLTLGGLAVAVALTYLGQAAS